MIKNKIRRTLYQTKKLAKRLQGSSLTETARNDWNFIFNHIKYERDKPGREQVRSPRRLIHDGRGDCDCFTVTLSSFLLNQGIPHFLRIMKETEANGWSHIYIVVPKDGNVKKKLTSRSQYIVMDCVTNQFDFEPTHVQTKDFAMALEYLDGLSAANACPTKPISQRIQHYVYTDQVVEQGLVPTRQLLEQKKILAIPKPDGSFQVSTSAGLVDVPSIITQKQADNLVADTATNSGSQQVTVPAETAPKTQASGGWLWALLIAGIGTSMLLSKPKETGLSGIKKTMHKKKSKRLKSYHL